MANLKDYYKDLLVWEDIPHIELIHSWPPELVKRVVLTLRHSAKLGNLIGLRCPIRKGSTNQSIGNQVEEHVIPILAGNISDFALGKCSGAGYPDQVLTCIQSGLKIPLEVKATSDWNPNDSNRRVLTSSSDKIRKEFTPPIHHLLLTMLYKVSRSDAIVEHIRLDFLEPTTSVSVRLEASVNHKILSHGTHTSIVI